MKKVKVKCISVGALMEDSYTLGKTYTMTIGDDEIIRHDIRIQSNEKGEMGNFYAMRAPGTDMHRYCIVGFLGTVFDAKPNRFRKANRSAAFGDVDIDYSRCKRSIRNQARNLSKEHFSCGSLEKIARGYGR